MHSAKVFILMLAMLLGACSEKAAVPEGNGASTPEVPTTAVAAGAPTLWAGGKPVPLEVQTAHPNGVVLQLTSIQSRPTETVIGVRVLNGRDRAVELNRFNNNRDGYLALDTGERLYLSPPASNARLNIEAGQTLEGELVFLGRLPPSQTAVLILNENSQTDSEHTTTPGFRINLPLASVSGSSQ
jgi:hypothetical protein